LKTKGIEESKLEHIREIFIDGYKERKRLNNYELNKKIESEVKIPEIQVIENELLNNEIQLFK
jgi:hypothetical protein